MPIPNHCAECDKPLTNDDGYLCESCQEKEREKNMVTTTSTGEDLSKILPSMKDESKGDIRRG